MARRWPAARVDGFDVDPPSVERGRRHAVEAGVAERGTFSTEDIRGLEAAQAYDLVIAVECVHDLPDPVGGLAAMRRLVRPGGAGLGLDQAAAGGVTPPRPGG